MGLPKSLSQLHKRENQNSADHCPAWVFTPSLQFIKPSWAHRKKAETSTAHVHNSGCRWYLFTALEELKQYIPLCWILVHQSHEKAVWQYKMPQHLGIFMYTIITYIIKYRLCPMTRADCTSQAQIKDEPRTPACCCAGMESHPFPNHCSQEPHASGSQADSKQKPNLPPPPVRAEGLKMRNGDLNSYESALRPLDPQTKALHCSQLPLPTVFPGT